MFRLWDINPKVIVFSSLLFFVFGTLIVKYTVGFHNFNLRIFDMRVSNPNKLIVDDLFDTMSDFNVPGSRPETTR